MLGHSQLLSACSKGHASLRPLCRPLSFPCEICRVVPGTGCPWKVEVSANVCGTQEEEAAGDSERGLISSSLPFPP